MKIVSFCDPKSREPYCAIEAPHGKIAIFKFFGGEWVDVSTATVPRSMLMSPLESLACATLLPDTEHTEPSP